MKHWAGNCSFIVATADWRGHCRPDPLKGYGLRGRGSGRRTDRRVSKTLSRCDTCALSTATASLGGSCATANGAAFRCKIGSLRQCPRRGVWELVMGHRDSTFYCLPRRTSGRGRRARGKCVRAGTARDGSNKRFGRQRLGALGRVDVHWLSKSSSPRRSR